MTIRTQYVFAPTKIVGTQVNGEAPSLTVYAGQPLRLGVGKGSAPAHEWPHLASQYVLSTITLPAPIGTVTTAAAYAAIVDLQAGSDGGTKTGADGQGLRGGSFSFHTTANGQVGVLAKALGGAGALGGNGGNGGSVSVVANNDEVYSLNANVRGGAGSRATQPATSGGRGGDAGSVSTAGPLSMSIVFDGRGGAGGDGESGLSWNNNGSGTNLNGGPGTSGGAGGRGAGVSVASEYPNSTSGWKLDGGQGGAGGTGGWGGPGATTNAPETGTTGGRGGDGGPGGAGGAPGSARIGRFATTSTLEGSGGRGGNGGYGGTGGTGGTNQGGPGGSGGSGGRGGDSGAAVAGLAGAGGSGGQGGDGGYGTTLGAEGAVGLAGSEGGIASPAPTAPPPLVELTPEDEWTILVYMSGEYDTGHAPHVELDVTGTLRKLEYVRLDGEPINVVVQVDRSTAGSGDQRSIPAADLHGGDWSGTRRGLVTFNPSTEFESFRTALLPVGRRVTSADADEVELNMADPAVLADFLRWGKSVAPARRYAVVVLSHAAESYAMVADEPRVPLVAPSVMSPADFRSAFETAGLTADLLWLDTCTPQTVETLTELAGVAQLVLASQDELKFNDKGMRRNVIGWLGELAANPALTAIEAGARLIELTSVDEFTPTLSLLATQHVQGLNRALDDLVGAALAASSPALTWDRLRVQALAAPYYYVERQRDLAAFLEGVAGDAALAPLQAPASRALAALRQMNVVPPRGGGGLNVNLSVSGPTGSYPSRNL
ncbi:MAG TPA: hypothetical protein VK986_16055, partial [Tepidisphaeraceae bacterium]|nr:hypothetical protein [Tepidisphaeraceae bacterium]